MGTFFGKLFLFINLGISLMLAVAAGALYLNRIDLTDKAGKEQGPLPELRKKIDALLASRGSVEARWREARAREGTAPNTKGAPPLLDLEKRRFEDRDWYQKELAKLAKSVSADSPAMKVKLDEKTFQPIPDEANSGRPTMEKAQFNKGDVVKSLFAYQVELGSLREGNRSLLGDQVGKIKDSIVETDRLGGTTKLDENDNVVEKGKEGLDEALRKMRVKAQGLQEELRLTDMLATDAEVNVQLAEARLATVDEDIQVLERYLQKRKVDVRPSKR